VVVIVDFDGDGDVNVVEDRPKSHADDGCVAALVQ
jgi:hypothetical protein